MVVHVIDRRLAARPRTFPWFGSYVVRGVGDPTNTAAAEELAVLHPRTVAHRRAAFVAGRTAAHAALAALGRDVPSILMGSLREPLWPDGIVGSISHAGEVAIAIAAPSRRTPGVGVDIEAARPAPELWDQVPVAAEERWLRSIPDPVARDRALLALFSAKEALYKALFPRVGHYFGFEAAALSPTGYGFAASMQQLVDGAFPPGRTIPIHSTWLGGMVRSWLVLPT